MCAGEICVEKRGGERRKRELVTVPISCSPRREFSLALPLNSGLRAVKARGAVAPVAVRCLAGGHALGRAVWHRPRGSERLLSERGQLLSHALIA